MQVCRKYAEEIPFFIKFAIDFLQKNCITILYVHIIKRKKIKKKIDMQCSEKSQS